MIDLQLFKPTPSPKRDTSPSFQTWSPPPEVTIHINVDAMLFSFALKMGVGVVTRNHTCECIIACNELTDMVTMPETAEALALHRATSLADEEGFH